MVRCDDPLRKCRPSPIPNLMRPAMDSDQYYSTVELQDLLDLRRATYVVVEANWIVLVGSIFQFGCLYLYLCLIVPVFPFPFPFFSALPRPGFKTSYSATRSST